MNWQEFAHRLPKSDQIESADQWRIAVDNAEDMLSRVDEADRAMAQRILGDTLFALGARRGYIQPTS